MKSSPLLVAMKTQQQCCNAAMKTQHNQKKIFLMNKIIRFLIKRIDYLLSSLTADL